jgi:hypothetical protein
VPWCVCPQISLILGSEDHCNSIIKGLLMAVLAVL